MAATECAKPCCAAALRWSTRRWRGTWPDRGSGDRGDLGAVGGAGRVALDSLIEIGASTVVIWELSGTGEERQRRGLRLIGYAFAASAVYLLVRSTVVLAAGYHPIIRCPGSSGRR